MTISGWALTMKKTLLIMATIFLLANTGVDAKSPVKGNLSQDTLTDYKCKYNEERDGSKRGIKVSCKHKTNNTVKFRCYYMEQEANLHNDQRCGYKTRADAIYEKLAKKIVTKKPGACGWGKVYIRKCEDAPMFLKR